MSKEGFPATVTTADLAWMLGYTDRRIRQLTQANKLTRATDGEGKVIEGVFPFPLCIHQFVKNQKAESSDSDDEKELNELKKHILRNKAEQGDIDLDERKNEVHNSNAVRQIFGNCVVTIRSRLQALPHLVAPNLQSKESIPEIVEIVTKGVNQVLLELKDYDPKEFAQHAKLSYKQIDPEKVQADIDAAEAFNSNYGIGEDGK
jgi:hypothetical protein